MKCITSKSAWRRWKASGGSRSGAAFDAMRQAKKDVKEYVKLCRAREERKKIQKQDQLFKNLDPARFHIPRQKAACRKLVVDGNAVTCEVDLLNCWKAHISELAKSKLDANSAESRVESDFYARSFGHNDQVLSKYIVN